MQVTKKKKLSTYIRNYAIITCLNVDSSLQFHKYYD